MCHCNTLQHAATHCKMLQHAATHCNKLAGDMHRLTDALATDVHRQTRTERQRNRETLLDRQADRQTDRCIHPRTYTHTPYCSPALSLALSTHTQTKSRVVASWKKTWLLPVTADHIGYYKIKTEFQMGCMRDSIQRCCWLNSKRSFVRWYVRKYVHRSSSVRSLQNICIPTASQVVLY